MKIYRSISKHSLFFLGALFCYLSLSYFTISWKYPLLLNNLQAHPTLMSLIKDVSTSLLLLVTSIIYGATSTYLFIQMLNTLEPKYTIDNKGITHNKREKIIRWKNINHIQHMKYLNILKIHHNDSNKRTKKTFIYCHGLKHSANDMLNHIIEEQRLDFTDPSY